MADESIQLPGPLLVFANTVEKLSKKSYYLGFVSVFFMMFPILFDVLARLIFHSSMPGAVELTEISMLLLVTLSFAAPQLNNDHMHVELIFDKLATRAQNRLMLFHMSVSILFTLVMTIFMAQMTLEKYHYEEYTPDLELPVFIFITIATFGIALFFLAVVRSWLITLYKILYSKKYIDILIALACATAFCSFPWWLKDTILATNMAAAGAFGMVCMLTLLLFRMPIGIAMGTVGLLGMMLIYPDTMSGLNMTAIAIHHVGSSYTYSVIPMFILMGEIALFAGISAEIFRAVRTWFGAVPGGLCVASVAGCAGFAAICGDSLATAMTMGSVALPEMKKSNYNMGLSTACLSAGGTLGILIPPSIGFIFYAVVTEASLGSLFLAGVLPGLLMACLFCGVIIIKVKRDPSLAPLAEKTSLGEKIRAISGVIPMIALIILVLGGILSGICSPTEGGAIGAFGTLVFALATRSLPFRSLMASLRSTCFTTVRVLFMLIGVGLLGYFFAATRLPFMLADWIIALNVNRWIVLVIILGVYMIMGCLMNVVPMILLTLPALFPTVLALGFDPIWFGVVTVIMMEAGQITPPVGIVVFAMSSMEFAPPMAEIFRNILPFVGCMLLCILMLALFPQIALFLPSMLI